MSADRHTIVSLGAGKKPRSWKNLSLEDRFWLRCERQPNGYLLWTGAVTGNGYGVIDREGKPVGAHVVAWETIAGHGPVPAGKELDHLCRSRRCVEPAHLEPVPHRVTLADLSALLARHERPSAGPAEED